MGVILLSLEMLSVLEYLEDVVPFLKIANMDMDCLRQAFELVWDSRVTLRLKKSFFFAKRTDCVQHAIG